jgi:hypothetical protein
MLVDEEDEVSLATDLDGNVNRFCIMLRSSSNAVSNVVLAKILRKSKEVLK